MGNRDAQRGPHHAAQPQDEVHDDSKRNSARAPQRDEPQSSVEAGWPRWVGDDGFITEEEALAIIDEQDRATLAAFDVVPMRTMWLGHALASTTRRRS